MEIFPIIHGELCFKDVVSSSELNAKWEGILFYHSLRVLLSSFAIPRFIWAAFSTLNFFIQTLNQEF